MSMKVTDDLPVEFDPEIAFAAVANIIAALRVSYGLRRIDIGERDGGFIATVWWGEHGCAAATRSDANAALKAAIAIMREQRRVRLAPTGDRFDVRFDCRCAGESGR